MTFLTKRVPTFRQERARWRLQRAETELSKLKDSPEPLSAADLTQYQDAVMVYQE